MSALAWQQLSPPGAEPVAEAVAEPAQHLHPACGWLAAVSDDGGVSVFPAGNWCVTSTRGDCQSRID